MTSRNHWLDLSSLFAALLLAAAAHGASFSYNQAATDSQPNNSIRAEGHVLNFNGNPPLDTIDSQQFLQPNHVQPGGTHDWGKDAIASSTQGPLAGSGDAFVTFDALSPAEFKVRVSSDGLASGVGPAPNGGRADGLSSVQFDMVVDLNNLTAGGLYAISYGWSVDAAAGGPAAGNAGGSGTQGDMQIVNMGPPVAIFNESVFGIPEQPLQHITPSGTGSFNFLAPGPAFQMVVEMHVGSGANVVLLADVADTIGSTFYGEATFTINQVPEPAGLAIVVIGVSLITLCRQSARSRHELRR